MQSISEGARWWLAIFFVTLAQPVIAETEGPWEEAAKASLVALTGEATTLSALLPATLPEAGAIVVVWSLYQPESRRAIRDLEVFRHDREDRPCPAMVAVAIPEYREGLDAIASFLTRAKVRFPVAVDPTRAVPRALAPAIGDMTTLPHAVWVTPKGEVRSLSVGWRKTFREDLERVLRATSQEASE